MPLSVLLGAHRSGFVDQNRPAFHLESVELLDRFLGDGVILHRDETETLGTTSVLVADNDSILHLSGLGEDLLQIVPGRGPGKVADV